MARTIGLESIEKFKSFLALPNDAAKPDDIKYNISWAKSELEALGFEVNTLETSALPLLLANLSLKKSKPTLAFYMHLYMTRNHKFAHQRIHVVCLVSVFEYMLYPTPGGRRTRSCAGCSGASR